MLGAQFDWGAAPSASMDVAPGHGPQVDVQNLFRNANVLAPMVRAGTLPLRHMALQNGDALALDSYHADKGCWLLQGLISCTERSWLILGL